ncbi:hypothetical protein ABW21_db0200910 [Orbilia brochopaga]|nr:hypothetical protein ABW21_db0200910 [Drechslerella brochopaga]
MRENRALAWLASSSSLELESFRIVHVDACARRMLISEMFDGKTRFGPGTMLVKLTHPAVEKEAVVIEVPHMHTQATVWPLDGVVDGCISFLYICPKSLGGCRTSHKGMS